jgi:hypothetical protein
MTFSLSTKILTQAIQAGFGDAVTISARRPGRIFQVTVPAYLPDGDAALLFVEPTGQEGIVRVSDLAHTMMRLSYTIDDEEDAAVRLEQFAARQGFDLVEGSLTASVPVGELLGALLGLAQVEATAEFALAAPALRGPRPEEFRAMVIEALRREFRDALELGVLPPGESSRDFEVDAIVRQDRPVAIAIVPTDLEAERAVGTRFKAKALDVKHWVAIPRDVEKLSRKTRERLTDAFFLAGSKYDESAVLPKLRELAA